jgi:tetratricopeptide (TPR) repeat protein
MKRYTDSTYFDRIIEFEADFNSFALADEEGGGSPGLEPGFIIQYIPDDLVYVKITRQGYFLQQVADINNTNPYGLKFAITNNVMDLSLEDAYKQIAFADSILKYEKPGPGVYLYKGIVNGMVQNYKTAISEYDRALSLNNELLLAYLNRAQAYFEMAEHQFVEENYSRSVTITWGEFEDQPAEKVNKRPDYEPALRDLNRAIELAPELPFAYFNRGNVKNRMSDYRGAVEDYTKAIEQLGNFAEAYYNRGLTLLVMKENERACKDLSRAGELGMKDAYRIINRFCK